jgi:hypothetical protein
MSNEKLIGSISEEKAKQWEIFKQSLFEGDYMESLDANTKHTIEIVAKTAYSNGWIDCRYTCIKKISELS